MDSEQRKKAIVVGAIAVVSLGVLVWGLKSYFGTSTPAAKVDPAVQQQLEQMQAEAEKAKPKSAPPPGPTEKGSTSPFLGPGGR